MSSFYRTYSSPNINEDRSKCLHRSSRNFYVVGDRVYVDGYRAGSVAYFGELDFSSGDWVGVVLDQPTGNHDGKVHGREYFHCAPHHGILVRPTRVTRMPDSELGSNKYASHLQSGRLSKASTNDSYYYDEDYRPDRTQPSFESLERRLKSMGLNNSAGNNAKPTSGILKSPGARSRSRSISETPLSARLGHLPSSSSGSSRVDPNSVFEFRPKRVELDDHHSGRSSGFSEASGAKQLGVDLSTEPLREGERVLVQSERGQLIGILRFSGQTNFATGEWAGVELDEAEGRNDGSVLGCRYFRCEPNRGLFVPLSRVSRYSNNRLRSENARQFSDIRNTIKSPPPRQSPSRNSEASSSSPNLGDDYSSYSTSSRSSLTTSPTWTSPGSQINSFRSQREWLPFSDQLKGFKSKSLFEDWDKRKFMNPIDDDLDFQLRRNLSRKFTRGPPSTHMTSKIASESNSKAKSIKYTFKSSKYDGNPIALKTIEYDS